MSPNNSGTPGIVLLVEHEPRIRPLLKRILPKQTRKVITAGTAARALEIASSTALALVILDDLPGRRGTAVLERLRRIDPEVAVILVTELGSIEAVRTAMELGASDYLPRPFDRGNFEQVVHAALAARR